MAKKLPLLISTLTILVSILSASNVGATEVEEDLGPWSFDELFAARLELKAIVEAECPQAAYTRNACLNRIMENKGGIYYTGMLKFQYGQFMPISIDFKNNTLDYYYSSEDLYRNYYWKLPYTGDYLTKLVIVQPEKNYPGNVLADLRQNVESSHWRVIYDSTKDGNDINSLPFDRRATLSINKPSFDPEYEQYLQIFYTDVYDEAGRYTKTYFTDCIDGKKYDIWLDGPNANPYFKDFSYSDGYTAGYSDGSNTGYTDGYNVGYNDGYANGKSGGYLEGFNEGRLRGYDDGRNEGYMEGYFSGQDSGYMIGYSDGQSTGHDTGYQEGYITGHADGHEEGLTEGRADGYAAGYSDGLETGRSAGYTEGYSLGYDEGYNLGYSAALLSITDNITNSNDDMSSPDSIINATINENTASGTSSIELSGATKLQPTNPSTPDTGAATREDDSQVEFQWWLGAIFTIGLATLCWLFWPNHQKRSKSSKK